MNWEIQTLIILLLGVFGSFHPTPVTQFGSPFNSTFLSDNNQLFRPVIIPNVTKYLEPFNSSKSAETVKTENSVPQSALRPEELSREQTTGENYLEDDSRVNENPHKFSSRYSMERKELLKTRGKAEGSGNLDKNRSKAAEVPEVLERVDKQLRSDDFQENEEQKLFSEQLDDLNSSEEKEEDVRQNFDTNEPEESEVAPTTNEPYQDLPRPTSFRNSPYLDDLENYETTSILAEEKNDSEEEETEEKRSADDHKDSGSRNYHSVQTPLEKIQYRGPHSFQEDFDPMKVRTRLVSPVKRPPSTHNWPYSKTHIKTEPEEDNEIPESDVNILEEGIKKELKGKPNLGLELAVEKDETKFDRNKKYNYLEERNRGKQKLKGLAAEEEKDHRLPFQTWNQYEVEEEPRYHYSAKSPSKLKFLERSRAPPITTTVRNIFKDQPESSTHPKGVSTPHKPNFQSHRLLGPVIFNKSLNEDNTKYAAKTQVKVVKKEPSRHTFSKNLQEKEKLDQDHLISQRIEKTIFGSGNADSMYQSFNHVEESEELYRTILANIQSVFGVRTNRLKSNPNGGRNAEVDQEESKALTWFFPLAKSSKVE